MDEKDILNYATAVFNHESAEGFEKNFPGTIINDDDEPSITMPIEAFRAVVNNLLEFALNTSSRCITIMPDGRISVDDFVWSYDEIADYIEDY
jgi:hypothetical protein